MMDYLQWILQLPVPAGLTATLLLVRLISPLAIRIGLVDVPDQRKRHDGAVPLAGGIALTLAYFLLAFVVLPQGAMFAGFAICIGILVVVGLLDDFGGLRPGVRLVAQFGVAGLLIFASDVRIESLGNLLGNGEILLPPVAGTLVTAFCVVSVINGLNMIDGLDGLAGGTASIMLAVFVFVAFLSKASAVAAHFSVLLACLLGFLVFHNFRSPLRRRLVFLGDAGSMVLGFSLAWIAIVLAGQPGDGMYPVSAVWILGLIVLDTVATVFRRLLTRRNPLSAGRDHLHHLLLELGCTPQQSVVILLSIAAAMAAIGVAGWQYGLPEVQLAGAFVLVAIVYFVVVNAGWHAVFRRGATRPPVLVTPQGVLPAHQTHEPIASVIAGRKHDESNGAGRMKAGERISAVQETLRETAMNNAAGSARTTGSLQGASKAVSKA